MVGTVSTPNTPRNTAKRNVVQITQIRQLLGSQVTGRLTVHAAGADQVPWRLYINNGQVHYVTSTLGQRERLAYFLQKLATGIQIQDSNSFKSDYAFLCQAWRSGQLTFQSLRNLILEISQEALIHALKVPEVEMTFEKNLELDPILLSAPAQDLITPVSSALVQWSQLYKTNLSPFSRVSIKQPGLVQEAISQHSLGGEAVQHLVRLLVSERCLYEVAMLLKVDAMALCAFLQPLILSGAIEVSPYTTHQKRPLIACIDDSKTVQRNVRLILEASGYQALELLDPTRALTTLVRHKPSLILMDISMPGIDGYELCRMLRSTSLLKEIPIIMLTGRDGVVDRLRARMVGANDYLTKPCEANQLLALIQKLLKVETSV